MQSKYSFVCDAANFSKSNNLNVLGIFNNINAVAFPYVHPKFTYVANIIFHPSETGSHKFKLSFVDEDGKELIPPLNGEIKVTPPILESKLIVELPNIKFPRPGVYQMDLTVNNHHICSETININQLNSSKIN